MNALAALDALGGGPLLPIHWGTFEGATHREVLVGVSARCRAASATSVMFAAACSPGVAPRLLIVVSDSAGVPVYELESLPSWDEPGLIWDLELQRAIETAPGTDGGTPELYQPQAYTRLEDGTLVVLDAWDTRLAVVAPDEPTVIRRFGPSGQGPGEIRSANSVLWPADGRTFWVLDPGNARLSRFDVEGALLEEGPVAFRGSGGYTAQDPVRHRPHFWRSFRDLDDPRRLIDSVGRLDPEGHRTTYFAALPPRPAPSAPSTSSRVLFGPKAWFAPLGTGGIVVARNDRARFHHYSANGELLGIVVLPAQQLPVPQEDEGDILAEYLGIVRGEAGGAIGPRVAETYPLWDIMWPLGDSLFALQQHHRSAIRGEPPIPVGQMVWRVVSPRGEYRGAIVFPPGFAQPYWLERDVVVGTRRDELGVATIEAYRLRVPGG